MNTHVQIALLSLAYNNKQQKEEILFKTHKGLYDNFHATIFEALEIYSTKAEVKDYLESKDIGFLDLETYCYEVSEEESTESLIQALWDAHRKDVLRKQLEELYADFNKKEVDSETIYAKIQSIGVDKPPSESKLLSYSQVMEQANNDTNPQLLLGLDWWDKKYSEKGGARKGQIEYAMAHIKHGKTNYGIWRAEKWIEQGYKGLWFQFEDTALSTMHLMVTQGATGKLMDDYFWVADGVRNVEEAVYEIRTKHRTGKVDFVIFDYIQNMRTAKKTSNRRDEVDEIAGQIRDITRELKISTLVLSQVTPDKTKRGWKHFPEVRDMKESSQMEQDATVITAIFRPNQIADLISNDGKGVVSYDGTTILPFNYVAVKQRANRKQQLLTDMYEFIHTEDKGLQPYARDLTFPYNSPF